MDLDTVSKEDEIVEYVTLQRPACSSEVMDQQPAPESIVYSDEEGEIQCSSDSDDSDNVISKNKPIKRKYVDALPPIQVREPDTKKKKYNVWSDILQEEAVESQFIDTQFFDHSSRGNESYNYRMKYFSEENQNQKRNWLENFGQREGQEQSNRGKSKYRPKHRISKKSVILSSLELSIDDSNEKVADEIAKKLNEPKSELIGRVVNVLGRECAIKIYNLTKDLEEKGGLTILNGSRRRTSGGVYLKLVKDQKLPRKKFDAIFESKNDFKPQRRRKWKSKEMEDIRNKEASRDLPFRYELEIPNQSEESDSNVLQNPPPSPVHHIPSESENAFSFPAALNSALSSNSEKNLSPAKFAFARSED